MNNTGKFIWFLAVAKYKKSYSFFVTRHSSLVIIPLLLTVVFSAGCQTDPAVQARKEFDSAISAFEQVPVKEGKISDFESFYTACDMFIQKYSIPDKGYAVDRLKDMILTADHFPVRAGGALVLGRMGTVNDILPLISALGDRNEFVRKNALKSLTELTHEEFGYNKDAWENWWKEKEKKDAE